MSGPLRPGRFFLPGPTEVDESVLEAQAAPVFGHRGPEARALVEAVDRGLRPLFGTERPVLLGTMSATGFMEAAIRCGVRRRVLCIVNGAFSARFARIARDCGREVDVLEVPWGRAVDPGAVAERLAGGGFDALTLAHSETSTGALNPVAEVAAVAADHPDVMVLVDSVTGVGGAEVQADGWGLDVVLTGSQKALAMPPGLAFAVVSDRLLSRARQLPDRGFYLDLVRYADQAADGQTPTTPALTLLLAARTQLERIAAETVPARLARHRRMAEVCHRRIDALRSDEGIDLTVVSPPGERSPTVTCLRLPAGRTGPEVAAGLRDRGFVVGAGYGRWKNETVRIGHMGDHAEAGLQAVVDALAAELRPPGGA